MRFVQAARRAVYHRRFLQAYKSRRDRLDYPPLLLNVEPTNRCNLRCPFCPVSQAVAHPTVRRGFMTVDVATSLAEQLRAYAPPIALNMGGESTLHPRLPELCQIFRSIGSYVFLDTNATLLTDQRIDGLLTAGVNEVVVCIDGDGSAESYAAMRVGGDLGRTVENIRRLLTEVRRRRLPTSVVVKNIQYYRPGARLAVPNKIKEFFAAMPPDEFRTTWADFWPGDHKSLLGKTYDIEPHAAEATACLNLWKKMAVGWDGRVSICCLDLNQTTDMGDVVANSVMEVWNGPGLVRARQQHAVNDHSQLPVCASCPGVRRAPPTPTSGLLQIRRERHTNFVREN